LFTKHAVLRRHTITDIEGVVQKDKTFLSEAKLEICWCLGDKNPSRAGGRTYFARDAARGG
jgi:hypothetical protein